ncbi:Paf1 complex component [Coemansia sp. RSA 989]|nr:Leo1-like protein-domain-containing protein [Coemansia mojavensis]KAJ1751227.1 Paf1 complex component [Coemansia sp. RSA 1821]KAJ1866461.1 Paf1 complex component [Coemansia sp. RSA 989]KAJ1874135.1 Paf1 complex component [Coemansia sp. RSA 990]KAJ2629715.1 Paf1 complex component [Coemansia sp. RSA 1290]KAJ2649181.1 Paf1 complex component [Coemansia sp. RSA 1250]
MSDLFGSDVSDIENGNPSPQTPTSPRAFNGHTVGTPAPDDLFGSDEDIEMLPRSGANTPEQANGLFGSDEEMSDHHRDQTETRERLLSTTIPKLPLPQSVDGRFVVARAPNILQLNPTPFTAEGYQDILQEEHEIAEKHGYRSAVTPALASAAENVIANTIRWRQAAGGRKRESNARLVRWSDGSTTILIGGTTPEVYSISSEQLTGVPKEKYYYAVAAHEQGLGHAHARISEQWLLRSSGQSAQARSAVKMLLDRVSGTGAAPEGAGANTARAGASRTRFMVVDEAPELRARREEEEEEKRERQRRREERNRERREAREQRANRGVAFAGEYSEEETGYGNTSEEDTAEHVRAPRRIPRQTAMTRGPVRSSYMDEDDDGFIVDDDVELEVGSRDEFDEEEEEELAAQRLRAAKQSGYSSEETRRRPRGSKSRRQLDSDDDDEMDDF